MTPKPTEDPSPPAVPAPRRHYRMSARQRRFVEEYVLDPSPARAARRAGFSKGYARRAYLLTRRPDVAAAIREAQAAAQARAAVTVDRIIAELAKLAFADPRDLFTADGRMKSIHELDDANAAGIASLEVLVLGGGSRSAAAKAGMEKVRAMSGEAGEAAGDVTPGDVTLELRKIKRWDKTKALELLGRYLGLFKDRLDLGTADDLATAIEAARKRSAAPMLEQAKVVEGEARVVEEAHVVDVSDPPTDSLSPRGRGGATRGKGKRGGDLDA